MEWGLPKVKNTVASCILLLNTFSSRNINNLLKKWRVVGTNPSQWFLDYIYLKKDWLTMCWIQKFFFQFSFSRDFHYYVTSMIPHGYNINLISAESRESILPLCSHTNTDWEHTPPENLHLDLRLSSKFHFDLWSLIFFTFSLPTEA